MTMTATRNLVAGYPAEKLAVLCPTILRIILDDTKIYPLNLQPGLSDWELQDAERVLRLIMGPGPFLGIAGVMLVSGRKRAGKGLFSNVFAWKVKRYFGKKILSDDKCPPLFGSYTLFNSERLMADIEMMAEEAESEEDGTGRKKRKSKLSSSKMKNYIKEWTTTTGEALMHNALIKKDEFWKDMNKRRPMDPMNLMFGGILKTIYHIDGFVVGVIQRVEDLDRFTCLPDVNIHAKCTWCKDRLNTVMVTIYHVEWSIARQALIPVTKRPTVLFIDGNAPQPQLGGLRWFDAFYSKNAPNVASFMRKSDRERFQKDEEEDDDDE